MLNFYITSFVAIPLDNFLLNGTLRVSKGTWPRQELGQCSPVAKIARVCPSGQGV
jgi:hypothetical protein